jgi:hypothetical protein
VRGRGLRIARFGKRRKWEFADDWCYRIDVPFAEMAGYRGV